MSAAEKLKALDGALMPAPWRGPERLIVNNVDLSDYAADFYALRNALPQIVALVQAAESYVHYDKEYQRRIDVTDIRTALAALDEVLP